MKTCIAVVDEVNPQLLQVGLQKDLLYWVLVTLHFVAVVRHYPLDHSVVVAAVNSLRCYPHRRLQLSTSM
jgi:hypothetical protein